VCCSSISTFTDGHQGHRIKMKRLSICSLAVAVFLFAAGGSATAADLNIKAFYGKFQGGGIAENDDSIYFGVTARDFDVTIEPAGNGFSVTWTSVIRGGGDPNKPNVRRKTTTRVFESTSKPGVWKAVDSKDPVTEGELCWARLKENTLSVYLMVVRADGAYEIQKYDRTLQPTGMEMLFTRTRDGEKVRQVKGRLVKVAR
ncbi:MAG: hypothetical protein ACPGRZ_08990, partial [Alphaproteobacteria bacterium]